MTADLVARLRECIGNEYMDETARRRLLAIADEMEAASALRSSGEAVAWESEDGRVISARQKATALRDGGASASSVAPYIRPLFAHPATPASAWRPIAELDHRDSRAVLFCDARGNRWTQTADCRVPVCGLPPTLWQELPTPPTSTKGG